jgi:hypothetical protein
MTAMRQIRLVWYVLTRPRQALRFYRAATAAWPELRHGHTEDRTR